MLSTLLSYLPVLVCGARKPKTKPKPKHKPNHQTFYLFPLLPLELRLHVWSLALSHTPTNLLPRQLALYRYAPYNKPGFSKISLSRKYPVLFTVNREARNEASRLLGGEWVDIDRRWTGTREVVRVHVRFDVDSVVLRGCGGLVVMGYEGAMLWGGHAVRVWECGGDGGDGGGKESVYVAGVKIKEENLDGKGEGRIVLE